MTIELIGGPQDGLRTRQIPMDGVIRIPRPIYKDMTLAAGSVPYLRDNVPPRAELIGTAFDVYEGYGRPGYMAWCPDDSC